MEHKLYLENQDERDSTPIEEITEKLHTVRQQVDQYGNVLHKVVEQLENVPDGTAVDAFKRQVLQKQMYLENLVEETSCELDFLKREIQLMSEELKGLKDALRKGTVDHLSSAKTMPAEPSEEQKSVIAAIRRHPLSSIPPRQLSEIEAMRFLQAIDEITTNRRRDSELPTPLISGE